MPEEEAAPQFKSLSALQRFTSEFETLGTPLLFIGLAAGRFNRFRRRASALRSEKEIGF